MIDNRARFRLLGVAVGVIAAIWAAVQGDWTFAIVFAVASVLMALAVIHQIRRPRDDA